MHKRTATLILAVLACLPLGCASRGASVPIERVRYLDVFKPPATFLDLRRNDARISSVNPRLVAEAIAIGEEVGFDWEFFGSVPCQPKLRHCYIFRESTSDHSYEVFLVDWKHRKLVSWFSFSERESGRPAD